MHDLKFITDTQFQEAQTAPLNVRAGVRDALPTHAGGRRRDGAGRSSSTPMAKTRTPRASPSGRRFAARTRSPLMSRCAAASSITTGAMATGARRPMSACRPTRPRPNWRWKARSPTRPTATTSTRPSSSKPAPPRSRRCWRTATSLRSTGDGLKFAARNLTDKSPANQRIRRGAVIRLSKDDKGRWAIAQLPLAEAAFVAVQPRERRDPGAGRRIRPRPQQVQPRDAGVSPARFVVQAVHLFGGAGKGLFAGDGHQRRAVLRARPRRPAARIGSPRTTTASSTARCGCATRWPSPRISSRFASCRRSARNTRRTTSRGSASTPSCIRPS